jgi:DNA gyrase inhibitor GyrI
MTTPKDYPPQRTACTMASCDLAHKVFDPQVEKGVQLGRLPDWTCVGGKVAYRVLRGPYEQLPKAWAEFPSDALNAARSAPRGPPGDVYLCTPTDHPGDPARMLTVLYLPVR